MRALPPDPFGSTAATITAPGAGTIFVPASARVAPRLPRWAQSTSVAEHPRCENQTGEPSRRSARRGKENHGHQGHLVADAG